MENSTRETLERIYHYCSGGNIKDTTREAANELMLNELSVEGSEVDLVVWYRPNRSISTLDLDALLDDLASEGKECVMLVQDYIARIKPSEYTGDTRLDYGTVVNDFTIIAKLRDIPVITAAQLNRTALKIVEQGIDNNSTDLGKKIGSAEVGESQLIINNCDMAIVVNKEYSETLNKNFLTFKLVASRYHEPPKNYFAHPFEERNGMRLIEDIHASKSYSVDKISDQLSGFNPNAMSIADESANGNPRFKNPTTQKANRFFTQQDGTNISDADFSDI